MSASWREAAELYEVSASLAIKWVQRWRRSWKLHTEAAPGKRFSAGQVRDAQSDRTLVETVAVLHKRRIRTSRSSLWRFLAIDPTLLSEKR
jgi:transposase